MKNNVDEEKIGKIITSIVKLINKNKLNIQEILITYGNLGYHLGASIAGFTDKGPGIEELKQAYYSDPTVDVGLMLQGLLITDWEADFRENQKLSKLAQGNKEKGENK